MPANRHRRRARLPTWSVTATPPAGLANRASYLYGVSCPEAGDGTAVGDDSSSAPATSPLLSGF